MAEFSTCVKEEVEEGVQQLSAEEIKKRKIDEVREFEQGLARVGWRGQTSCRDVVRAIFSGKDLPKMRAPEEQGIVEQVAAVVSDKLFSFSVFCFFLCLKVLDDSDTF